MNTIELKHVLLLGTAIGLSACATTKTITEELAVSTPMGPMAKVAQTERTRVHQLDKLTGSEKYHDVIEVTDDGKYRAKNSQGCEWFSFTDIVAPALSWNNCSQSDEWKSGEGRNMVKKGEIWPLEIGKKVSYTYTQTNAHGVEKGRNSRKCKVVEQVNITTALGSLDTYKVVCKRRKGDWSRTRVYYFSPEHNAAVKYVNMTSSRGIETNNELLRMEVL